MKTTVLGTVLAVAGLAQVASAVPSSAGLYLVDTATGATAFAADNMNGIATFNGTVGDYTVNISATGTTIAGGSSPSLDLDVANATAGTGATTLQVYYSDGAFGPTASQFSLATTGPASGGPITTSAYLGSTFFSQTTTLASSVDVYPFTVNGTGPLNSSSYYLTLEDLITGTEVSVDTHFSTVPDGGATMMLMGMALSGVGLLRKKFAA